MKKEIIVSSLLFLALGCGSDNKLAGAKGVFDRSDAGSESEDIAPVEENVRVQGIIVMGAWEGGLCELRELKDMTPSCFQVHTTAKYHYPTAYLISPEAEIDLLMIDDFDPSDLDEKGEPARIYHLRDRASGEVFTIKNGQRVDWIAKVGPTITPHVSAGFIFSIAVEENETAENKL